MSESESTAHDFAVHQEEDHVAVRSLTITGVVGIATTIAAVVVSSIILALGTGALRPRITSGPPTRPAATISNIEQSPVRQWRRGLDERAAQERELARWGWADRDAGIAIIPIETAIDVIAAAPDGGGR